LSAAEGKTLLHGDINQSNLLIDRAGTVNLIDWAQPERPPPPGSPIAGLAAKPGS
jgi:RIO-like serine/threonine protein kinase